MKSVLIIGSKPYFNLSLDNLLDSFENNYRCNFSLPGNNNGNKCDKLGLCNHLHDNLISNPKSKSSLIQIYKHAYKLSYIEYFHENFPKFKPQYSEIFYARPRTNVYNNLLSHLGCKHRFRLQPRTGYTVLFENLLAGSRIYVTNFSICSEIRTSHYVKEGHYESPAYHNAEDEICILRWLHEHKKIDATLCFLEDITTPTLLCSGLEPSNFIVEKIIQEYGKCAIKGFDNEKNN